MCWCRVLVNVVNVDDNIVKILNITCVGKLTVLGQKKCRNLFISVHFIHCEGNVMGISFVILVKSPPPAPFNILPISPYFFPPQDKGQFQTLFRYLLNPELQQIYRFLFATLNPLALWLRAKKLKLRTQWCANFYR